MKKILFAVWGFFLLVAASWAQENPVKWKCSVKYLKGNEAELVIKANVGGGYTFGLSCGVSGCILQLFLLYYI